MTFLKRLFRWKRGKNIQRVRICVECGMPIAEHKEWCSIFRTYALQQAKSRVVS